MKYYISDVLIMKAVDAVVSFLFFLSGIFMIGFIGNSSRMLEKSHQIIGGLFYLIFFWLLMKAVRKAKNSLSVTEILFNNNLKSLNNYKWISLAFTIILLLISIRVGDFQSSQTGFGFISFIIMKQCPIIFNQNAGFITITILAFMMSSLFNINKKLQEEQSLTI